MCHDNSYNWLCKCLLSVDFVRLTDFQNVETVEHEHPDTHKKVFLTIWDVGGCDKIRPLWRHYYQNTSAVVFVVDSRDTRNQEDLAFDVYRLAAEDELRNCPILVLANKQDLPDSKSPETVWKEMDLNRIRIAGRQVGVIATSGQTGQGLNDALDWLCQAINKPGRVPEVETHILKQSVEVEEEKTLLEKWLAVEDEPDDEFLEKLLSYTLDSWDHRTHLRIAWLYLTKYGRREGMKLIFSGIKNFIANSPRTRKTTFHETLTYFW
jgi:small GTP-binding protein